MNVPPERGLDILSDIINQPSRNISLNQFVILLNITLTSAINNITTTTISEVVVKVCTIMD